MRTTSRVVRRSVSMLMFASAWPIVSIGASQAEAQSTPASATLPELVARIKPSVVSVFVYKDDELVSRGSGWFLSPTEIVTNRHVLAPGARAEIQLATGEKVAVTGVLAETSEQDLVILAIAARGTLPKPIPLASSEPVVGSRVFTIGNPLGLELTVSEGIVSAVRHLPLYGTILQTTAAVSPGSSGGPLLDMHGRVVGVVTFRRVGGQALNFAIAADAIRSLRKTKGITASSWLATKESPVEHESWTLGIAALVNEDYAEAILQFQKVVEVNPSFAGAYLGFGLSHGMLGHHQKAIDACKQALRIKPDYAEAHLKLGFSHYMLGHHQKAVDANKQALRIRPDYADAHLNLGASYSKLGRSQNAIDAYKQAIRIKPDHANAHYNLGLAYGKLGRWQQAIDANKHAIRIKPDDAAAHVNLGVAYGELQRWQKAIDAHMTCSPRPDPCVMRVPAARWSGRRT